MRPAFLIAALALCFLSTPPARAGDLAAMVTDVETSLILTADRIDARQDPALIGRLSTLAMGLLDLENGTLSLDEELMIQPGETLSAHAALQEVALGEEGWRGPLTALAGRLGHNPVLFGERVESIGTQVGMLASVFRIARGEDGGPEFEGRTTLRDITRLAVSLLETAPEKTRDIFGPATGNLDNTHIWIAENGTCLLVADGPRTGRSLSAAVSGAPDETACFEAAATLLAAEDMRVLSAIEERNVRN